MAAPIDSPPVVVKRGKYTLLRLLGEGSQGATWEGRDDGAPVERPAPERLAKDFEAYVRRARAGEEPTARGLVAVKEFRLDRAKAWKDVELAEREARTLAALSHPCLPRYIEHFEEDGALYLVMEKIEGESLASLRARGGTLAPGEIERMLLEIGNALRYLHGRAPPVVHRDIKPGNVIRRPDGSFALVDFGAVRDKLKPAGGSTVVGTFGFMAPEQFQGRASPKSDLYGLGATALAMLTGVEPEDLPHRGLGIDVDAALPEGTPRKLATALRGMLVPDPEGRIASADDVLALLRRDATGADANPKAETKPAPPAKTTKSKPDRARATREERRRARREAREARRAWRARARMRRVPFLPRVAAKLGITIAILAVWLAVGLLTPAVLGILSLLFGPALRRAAKACVSAAQRSTRAMRRASNWLSGYRPDDPEHAAAGADGSTEAAAAEAGAAAPRVRVGPNVRVDGGAAAPGGEAATEEEDDEEAAEPARGRRARGSRP